jgi:hypothetical protein
VICTSMSSISQALSHFSQLQLISPQTNSFVLRLLTELSLSAEQPVCLLYSNLGTPLSHTLKIKMRYSLAVLTLAVAVQASPLAFPGGVTSAIAPSAKPPPGCTPSHASFGIAVLNISTAAKHKRQVSTISECVHAFV